MDDIQENLLQSSLPNQQLLSIDEELWLMAEERAQEILCTIQPNVVSEVNRKDIIGYVQRLIVGCYGAEVFPFGSVPLKTYLPDGDIDLTALSHENVEEDLAQAVCSILESGDDPEYPIKDIQYIRAQVKLVKCTVKNIAVDISFNQMAGLYALRFLEQVDQLVGKNHLFKRSIILIKAWCYYESRILGAHHGLLSTYAVEILVLYIINRFHSSVCGPLEVLYRFLDYYSTFDWDTYYVSIDGPRALSSLPEIVEKPECEQGEFLLSKELLKNYRDMCSVPAKAPETAPREFPTKHLNILDPLRNDNNLGRSVSRGNLHRIRFALSFGARKLKEILTLPGESLGAALENFFMNTLIRNGKGQRPDVDVPVPAFGTGRSEESVLIGDCDSYCGGLQYVQLYCNYAMPLTAHSSSPSSPSHTDMLALSTQQNWSMFYQRGTDLYVPTQTLYHPNASQATYNLEERGLSRGTGTYIPEMNHNTYRDMRTRVTRPRRHAPMNYNAFPRSHQRKQVEEEVHSETDMNDNLRSFEFSNEDFPLLSSIHKTSLSPALESSQLTGLEDFPLLSSIRKTSSSAAQESTQLTGCEDFPPLSNIRKTSLLAAQQPAHLTGHEDFPPLSNIRKTSLSAARESAKLSGHEDFPPLSSIRKTSSSAARESSQLTGHQDFPPLSNICKTSSSVAQESAQLTANDQSSSLSQLNIEFGTYKILQSLTKLSLGTKDEKEDSGVSSSQGTTLVVPSVVGETGENFCQIDEKMD